MSVWCTKQHSEQSFVRIEAAREMPLNRPGSGRGSKLLDFDQGLVGPFPSVEDGFELCGWLVMEVAVRAAHVVPVADGTSASC